MNTTLNFITTLVFALCAIFFLFFVLPNWDKWQDEYEEILDATDSEESLAA